MATVLAWLRAIVRIGVWTFLSKLGWRALLLLCVLVALVTTAVIVILILAVQLLF